MLPESVNIGNKQVHNIEARDVRGARDKILNLVQKTSYGSNIYFHGWEGMGAVAVLKSVEQVLRSMKDDYHPELCFQRIIYIDCSIWKSKRVMQKRIAEALKLDRKTMAMFDKQDEHDDLNGVDPTSRDVIRDVAVVIERTLRETSYVVIFLNGSDEEVALNRLGVLEFHDCIIIWTFRRKFPSRALAHADITIKEVTSKLRYTNIILGLLGLESSELSTLVYEEASSILTHHPYMQDNDQEMVVACYLYVLYLHHSFRKGANRHWATHGANYWICDEIIQGTRIRDISKALYQAISFECDDDDSYSEIMLHPDSSYYLVFYGNDPPRINRRCPLRWISITSKTMIFHEDTKNILASASSIFLPFEVTNIPQGLPDGLMEQCSNLRVLILSNCAFNFSSPLFGHWNTLRFLGLDHCINNYTTKRLEREVKWACLCSLWVLDLRYTDWDSILSKEKIDLMCNLIELNMEGFMCWQYMGELEGRLPFLERLRIIKPLRQAKISKEIDGPFMEKTKLEILNLSGNKDMKKLPTSLSKGSSLEVLVLDGCAGLETVVILNSLLRSFSFDGYGSASNWTSMDELPPQSFRPKCPSTGDKKDVRTTLITLQGCTQLKNLFLRGLPNLVELDLSGCMISILDFETMLVDVPRIKRLFLLGCENLCEIRWGTHIYISSNLDEEVMMPVDLEFLCIDTRPGSRVHGRTRSSIAQDPNKNFGLHVHASIVDARLVRYLFAPMWYRIQKYYTIFFDICITSSSIIVCDEKVIEEHHVLAASSYDDISTVVSDSFFNRVQAFTQPLASKLDRHLEIGYGSRNVVSEMEVLSDTPSLAIVSCMVESMHVHDTPTNVFMPQIEFGSLKWCRAERCPRLDYVFPPRADPCGLEIIYASDLLMAHCIWSKGPPEDSSSNFRGLRYLHLHSCPSLQFALPVWSSTFPRLETLHVIRCGSLKHVFALDNQEYNTNSMILFTALTTIHLHDVSALRQICEAKMVTPKLKTIWIRGCWNLRRLPALGLVADEQRRPTVEMEKDVWDALEWDRVDAGHHPSLYETCLHSRYCKSRSLLRGTVLR